MTLDTIEWQDFSKLDIRVGTILEASISKKLNKPAYILNIDFGSLGIKKSSAQITKLYQPADLIGKQIVAIVNFKPKQIGHVMSECLVLAGLGQQEEIIILQPERNIRNGSKVG